MVVHRWHTGFLVPTARIVEAIGPLAGVAADAPHVEIGWGDAGFYQASEVRSGLAFKALILSTESVVRVTPVAADKPGSLIADALVRLCLTDTELASLLQFIAGSLRRDADSALIPQPDRLAGAARFYAGVGDYHLFNTCNTWTAKGLHSAGMDVTPGIMLTAEGVMDYLRAHDGARLVNPSDWPAALSGTLSACLPQG